MAVEGLMAIGRPPVLPSWIFYLQIAIIVLSFGCLIAGAINVATFDGWAYYTSSSGPGGFTIFDAIFTWIVVGTMIVFGRWYHQFYIRLTYVVLLPLTAIFWLSAWAWSASVASAFRGAYNDALFRSTALGRYGASIAACAALGAFTWVAIIVLTIFYIIACLRDGEDNAANQTEMGMHTKTETPAPATATAPAPAPAPATDVNGFNHQTQDYYGAQPAAQNQVPPPQQSPYSQEMPSPEHYQQPQQGAPYPTDQVQKV
ncbi:hypothetical protein NLU13_4882 [Sarocladium strictum]|uniref:MARVEL domain-containing protein n=1 Tax=Sarocladium strictum TaxID=5046 RepID=A0AA39L9B7_SARSR|nr:hypothetical protein NLU13_4882 [Sarocladium strictum]